MKCLYFSLKLIGLPGCLSRFWKSKKKNIQKTHRLLLLYAKTRLWSAAGHWSSAHAIWAKSDAKGWYDEKLHSGNDELIQVSTQHFNKVWTNSFPHLKCCAFLRWFCLCMCTLVIQQISHQMAVPCQICCVWPVHFDWRQHKKRLGRTFTRGKSGKKLKKFIVNM